MGETLGFVGVTGGAGTTRTCVETAATLARDGQDVAIIDAAFGTQGLSRYVSGRIEPDLTATLVDERPVDESFVSCWSDLAGEAKIAPAHAPFERLARAKTAAAAQRLEAGIQDAAQHFDHVIVDVPPVSANQAVGAVNAVDRRVLVAPATQHGADLLPRTRGRLVDVGTAVDGIVATRASSSDPDETPLPEADAAIPAGPGDVTRPTAIDPDDTLAPAVATATETLFDHSLDLTFETDGLFG